jgi:hypothetical protein
VAVAGQRRQHSLDPAPARGAATPTAAQTWAADLVTVQTLTVTTLDVLGFSAHRQRQLVHVTVTASPTAAWVWRHRIDATLWGRRPWYLVRDRDAVDGGDVRARVGGLGSQTLRTPMRAPRAHAVADRVVGTVHRACLDHVVVCGARHLRSVLRNDVASSNAHRPHGSVSLETPPPATRPDPGPVRSRPVLGGLHHVVERAA